MSDSINELLTSLSSVWDSLVPAEGLPNLNHLPHQLHEALFAPGGVFDKLTNGGTVPLPVPSSWLESVSPSPPVATSPPPSSSTLTPRWVQDLFSHLLRHPYIYTLATLSASTGATYYYSPRTLQPLVSFIPAPLLPPPKNRPLRLLPSTHPGVAAEVRKEAALVLGADSVEGREIALDLEKKGWVVIATVSDPEQVDKLEREGRGWIKVLVLDPTESSSVSPFLRSLSTALSLRFPLHTSGDPFSRPSHALALTSLIDCLSLPSPSSPPALIPLEAIESDQIKRDLTERISTFILVSKGVLPFLRNSSSRPGAPTSVYLLLLPSISSNLSLPFLSLSSTLSQSLESLFHSLRRELLLSSSSSSSSPNRSNLRLKLLQTGSFHPSSPSSPAPTPTPTSRTESKPLPIRLSSIYAPALSRRSPSLSPISSSSSSSLTHLTSKITHLLLRPSHYSPISLVGSKSWTYYYMNKCSWVLGNHAVVDWVLKGGDWLVERVRVVKERTRKVRGGGGGGGEGGQQGRLGGGRGPLPELPKEKERDIPASLRPQQQQQQQQQQSSGTGSVPSQVPMKDSFVPQPQATQQGGGYRFETTGESESEEEDGTSSIEDLGVSTESLGGGYGHGNGNGTGSMYGTGSYVNV